MRIGLLAKTISDNARHAREASTWEAETGATRSPPGCIIFNNNHPYARARPSRVRGLHAYSRSGETDPPIKRFEEKEGDASRPSRQQYFTCSTNHLWSAERTGKSIRFDRRFNIPIGDARTVRAEIQKYCRRGECWFTILIGDHLAESSLRQRCLVITLHGQFTSIVCWFYIDDFNRAEGRN